MKHALTDKPRRCPAVTQKHSLVDIRLNSTYVSVYCGIILTMVYFFKTMHLDFDRVDLYQQLGFDIWTDFSKMTNL